MAFSIYQEAKNNEDKAEIQKCGLSYRVIIKLLMTVNYLSRQAHEVT
jgi:hypothetical protein